MLQQSNYHGDHTPHIQYTCKRQRRRQTCHTHTHSHTFEVTECVRVRAWKWHGKHAFVRLFVNSSACQCVGAESSCRYFILIRSLVCTTKNQHAMQSQTMCVRFAVVVVNMYGFRYAIAYTCTRMCLQCERRFLSPMNFSRRNDNVDGERVCMGERLLLAVCDCVCVCVRG